MGFTYRSCVQKGLVIAFLRRLPQGECCYTDRRLPTTTTRVDETLDTLSGSRWFTTFDLISVYWQVEVNPEDAEKTTFCTHDRLFESKVMPLGLCNAPATFQWLMDAVLRGLQWSNCFVYLHDVVIPGRNFEEHLRNLSKVFECLRNAGLKLHPSKCSFCCKQVSFLGDFVSQDGVATYPAKTSRVVNWPEPTSTSEVRQFLVLTSSYRQFVKMFATLAKPLHKLTEKNKKFKWTLDCQTAFETLCRLLISIPVLAYPEYNKPFILDTDASDIGIGAVLSQTDDSGRWHVVAYASRVLTNSERRYCVTRRELLAVVTFVKQFRPYLLSKHFTLRTDHGSLTRLCNFKEPEEQLARWLEQLQEYDYTIVHRSGRKHGNADAMSRMPCKQCGRVTLEETEQEILIIRLQTSTEQLRDSQLADLIIEPVLQAVEKKDRPSPDASRSQPPMMRLLFQQWDQLKIKESTLWCLFECEDDNSHHKVDSANLSSRRYFAGTTCWCLWSSPWTREDHGTVA